MRSTLQKKEQRITKLTPSNYSPSNSVKENTV